MLWGSPLSQWTQRYSFLHKTELLTSAQSLAQCRHIDAEREREIEQRLVARPLSVHCINCSQSNHAPWFTSNFCNNRTCTVDFASMLNSYTRHFFFRHQRERFEVRFRACKARAKFLQICRGSAPALQTHESVAIKSPESYK